MSRILLAAVVALPLFLPAGTILPLLSAPAIAARPDAVSDLKKKIDRARRARKYDQVLVHARALASQGGSKAAGALFEAGLRINVPAVFKGVAKLLAGMTDAGALEFFEKESKGRTEARLLYLTDILGEMKNPRAATLVGNILSSKNVKILRGAIDALAKLRVRESVPPLLDLVKRLERAKQRGLIYQEARDALFDVTGQDFDNIQDWEKWWGTVSGTFKPGAVESGATRVTRKSRDTAPEFVGRKIFASDVVFVIDTSGTMQYVMKDDIPGLARADGSDTAAVVQKAKEQITPENSRLAKFWTRLEMAKRELIKAISGFTSRARINVLEFNKSARPLQKRLSQVTPKLRKELVARVKRMEWVTVPGTNTLQAIQKAFSLGPSITAIYFLSDGLPSADGKTNDDPLPLLDEIEALNRFRKIKIHTFGYDPNRVTPGIPPDPELTRANEFLQKLAERTGGTFTLLKVTGEKPPPDFK